MKAKVAFFIGLVLLSFSLSAQVKFKVKLLTDNVTYQVLLKPDATWDSPLNAVPSAQVTLVVPTGGFQVGNLTNIKGNWSNNANIIAPAENPRYDYIVFGLQGATSAISFQRGVEVVLFSFKNNGTCTGALELIEHATDPFMPPNTQSINVGNQIAVIGAGIGVNAYKGNYNILSANCKSASNCGVQVFDISMKAPTTCGVADGSIEISAINTAGTGLQYSIDNGVTYSNNKTFINLAAGALFEIIVRDQIALCIVDVGDFEMEGPLAAVVTSVDLVNPDCAASNGSITIQAYSEIGNPLEYAINSPVVWQSSNVFSGLPKGVYKLYVRDVPKSCVNEIGSYILTDCPPEKCLITYELEKLPNDAFQISMIADTSWSSPNNIVSSAQWTIKVPVGGFVADNITSLISGVSFGIASAYSAPIEDPASEYISFILASFGTQSIPFTKGLKTPLFTFVNSGTCKGGSVALIDNKTDPFFPPNSLDANVGQQLTVSGYGGADAPVCVVNQPAEDCKNDPCAQLVPGFNSKNSCLGESSVFTNTTTSFSPIASWKWNFGDGTPTVNTQSPTHKYSSPGNYNVTLSVTALDGCTNSISKLVSIFSVPLSAPQDAFSMCPGDTVQLLSPASVAASWSPITGLSNAGIPEPRAFPSVTTVYYVTYTNSFNCTTKDTVTVTVGKIPTSLSVTKTNLSDCNETDGRIEITAGGAESLQYSINNGATWHSNNVFQGLPAGNYNVKVRVLGSACPITYSSNPVVLSAPSSASITQVIPSQPTACSANGSIEIIATGGTGILQYSINGGTTFQTGNKFTNLPGGTYKIVIANENRSCPVVNASDVVLVQKAPPTIVSSTGDISICEGKTSIAKIELSENIGTYFISGTGTYANPVVNGKVLSFEVSPKSGGVNYQVQLTNVDSCSVASSFLVHQIQPPEAVFKISGPLCKDGKVTLEFKGTADTTAILKWSLAGGRIIYSSEQTETSPAGAILHVIWDTAGSKSIGISVEQGGCAASVTGLFDILEFMPGATFGITNVATCGANTGAIKLSLATSGNYSFLWNGPGAEGITQQSLSNLPGGVYQVTITDENSGCASVSSGTVKFPAPVLIDSLITSPVSDCNIQKPNGGLEVKAQGGIAPFTYKLFDANDLLNPLITQNSNELNVKFDTLPAGNYSVEIISGAGCTASSTATVTSVASTFIIIGTDAKSATCGKSDGIITVQIQGGQSPYSYWVFRNSIPLLSDQILNSNSLELSGLSPADYNVLIIEKSGCVLSTSLTIGNIDSSLQISALSKSPACGLQDGSISLTQFPAGATFLWQSSNGIGLPSTSSLSSLAAGVYNLTVTDINSCTANFTYILEPSSGPTVSLLETQNASCGNANGSTSFKVLGSGAFSYKILNSHINGYGEPGDTISINGFEAGSFVLEIVDTTNSCKSYTPLSISGTKLPQIVAVTRSPSACATSDASICLQISNGVGPYTLSSSVGTVPGIAFNTEGCVQGLYEGLVNLKITDAAGCDIEMAINLPEQPKVNLAESDFKASSFTCPGEFGSIISNTSYEYSIFDTNNFYIGRTPLTKMSAGTYKVVHTLGSCSAELQASVSGPENWKINYSAQPETCTGKDGSITLSVSGSNSGYTYQWSTGSSNNGVTGISAGSEYAVTVTDSRNCSTTLKNIAVASDCNIICPKVFLVDTFRVVLKPGLNEICLPTRISDISLYDLTLNASSYLGNISFCLDSTIFYSYGMLLNLGTPPYRLEQWSYKGKNAPKFTFTTVSQLVGYLNILDPSGNWMLNNTERTISGDKKGSSYGSLVITHVQSNTTLSLQVNTLAVARPSIFVQQSPAHIIMVKDETNGCQDTLYINRIIPPPALKDSMQVQIPIGSKKTICFSTGGLTGTQLSLTNTCNTNSGAVIVKMDGQECITIEGMSVGSDTICYELCDDKGACKTIFLNIEIQDTSTALIVYRGFSPNEDGINDYFQIKNIELYPNNRLSVFNRWGLQVYSAQGYSNSDPWKGAFNSKILPDGTYFYILELDTGSDKKKLSGYVHIRR